MRRRIVRGDVEAAREAATFIGQNINTWEHGMDVVIEPHKPKRTKSQNAYYHVLCQQFADHVGVHRDDIKDWMSEEFAPRRVVELKDKAVDVPKSSREWSVEEASSMIERLKYEAATRGCNLV